MLKFTGPPEKPPPNPWWGVIILLLLLAGLMGSAYGAFWAWLYTGPKPVAVPDVIGVNEEAAASILTRSHLNPKVVARQYDERAEAGEVIRTSPGPNREVKQGRTIEMIVSQGSAWTWVPDVTEMSLARARGKLEEAHLRLGSRQATPDANVPPGYVARQRPAAQTRVRRNSPVDVFLSAPPAAEAPAVKYAQVQVSVPEGEGMQDVRIVVDDDDGERVAHQGQYPPGSQFTRTVAGRGSMTVRVFAGDELLQEKTY